MELCEIDKALSTFTILVDTREQKTERSVKRLDSMKVPYERKKLNFGDYSAKCVYDGTEYSLECSVAVERKMNIDELCNCFCSERKRFTREFERAKEAGAKIYLLIENADMEKMYNGKYRSLMKSNALIASLFTFLARYNSPFLFCKEETSGKVIRDVLYREMKEYLIRKTTDEEFYKT